jgi:hypothetical protein
MRKHPPPPAPTNCHMSRIALTDSGLGVAERIAIDVITCIPVCIYSRGF